MLKVRRDFERIKAQITEHMSKQCANCESTEHVEVHHIVPISLGGTNRRTNLVMLCSVCHDKAHGYSGGNRRAAQAAGIERARSRGAYKGRPRDEDLHARVRALLESGSGVRPAARIAQCSTTTVIKIRDAMMAEKAA